MKAIVKHHFDAAHRLVGYDGKCKNLHGHRWEVEVEIEGEVCIKNNMIVDFKLVKCVVDFFDHKTLLLDCEENWSIIQAFRDSKLKDGMVLFSANPTAEVIAESIAKGVLELNRGIKSCKVRVWESEGCSVEVVKK